MKLLIRNLARRTTEELQKLLNNFTTPNPQNTPQPLYIPSTPHGLLRGVDKTVDTFVPLTTLRHVGKLGITRAKALEVSCVRK